MSRYIVHSELFHFDLDKLYVPKDAGRRLHHIYDDVGN